jgi:hypothetical protein
MASITLRTVKGSPLSNAEMDDNFNNINVQLNAALPAASYTAADVLTKLKTVDGVGSGLDADLLDGYTSDAAATANTIALRDSNGDLFAGTVRATTVIANLTGNVTGNVTGTLTGNATNVSGTVAINNGGTGGSSVSAARSNLGLGTMAVQNASGVAITGGTISGLSTALAIADGGTGSATASAARSNLGVQIGSDVQPFSNELTGIAAATSTGIYVRIGSASITQRSVVTNGNGLVITNGNGVSGNISVDLNSSGSVSLASLSLSAGLTVGTTATISGAVTLPSITKSGSNGSGDIGQSGNRFGTVYGTATTAQYADLAERYTTDLEYVPGTVVVVSYDDSGAEATQSFGVSQRVLGVVSTNPAFLMNDEAPGQAIALRGRVPTLVVGPIRKGHALISMPDGHATSGEHQNSFAIALETNLDAGIKLVECVIL